MSERDWPAEKILHLMGDAQELTVKFLAQSIDRTPDKTRDFLQILVRRGLATKVNSETYRLTESGRLAANSRARVRTGSAARPREVRIESGNLRVRAWRALRIEGGKSTIPNLLTLIADGNEKSADTNLLQYFDALCRAGILSRLDRRAKGNATTSNGFVVWAIIRNVGPRSPIWQSTKNQVFDPNTNTTIPLPPKGATP